MTLCIRAAALLALAPVAAWAEAPETATQAGCPAVLESARQLALVTASGVNEHAARLTTYERDAPGAPWRAAGLKAQAVVGMSGFAWGWPFAADAASGEPRKTEGDKRTPVGFYPIGAPFGPGEASLPGYLRLAPGKTFCVDDARSPHYGRIVSKTEAGTGTSGEDMARVSLYRHGLVVDYPPNREQKAGSCIFIHIWRTPEKGTSGCVAMAEKDVVALQSWTRRGEAVIAALPRQALARFSGCLPGVEEVGGRD